MFGIFNYLFPRLENIEKDTTNDFKKPSAYKNINTSSYLK